MLIMNAQKSNFFSNILPELVNIWDEVSEYSSDTSYYTTTDSTIYWEASPTRIVGWF